MTAAPSSSPAVTAEKVSDFWAGLASNIELFELYTRLLTDPDGLSRQESERAHLVLDAFLAPEERVAFAADLRRAISEARTFPRPGTV